MKTEKIMCSAIWVKCGHTVHRPTNIDTGTVICGYRHCNCIETASLIFSKKEMSGHVQGFLTDKNKFVDRVEAKRIAERAGQLLESCSKGEELFSEDVWLIHDRAQ